MTVISFNADKKAAIDAILDTAAAKNFDGLEARRSDALSGGTPDEKVQALALEISAIKRKIGMD